ncbi:hypothetical protein ACIQRW_15260 [Streptomyces sp. NPDC091287]|uniref:hypothetical protein n=1 Tax=Streptomyces sp. NPDC091287 TaxID=3365988 RepID=UPI00382E5E0A
MLRASWTERSRRASRVRRYPPIDLGEEPKTVPRAVVVATVTPVGVRRERDSGQRPSRERAATTVTAMGATVHQPAAGRETQSGQDRDGATSAAGRPDEPAVERPT